MKKYHFQTFLILFSIPLFWSLLSYSGALNIFKNRSINWRYDLEIFGQQVGRGEKELPKNTKGESIKVIYADFDAKALTEIGERPWDRRFFAEAATVLLHPHFGNARCIGFDFIFSSQSMSSMVPPENVYSSDKAIGDLVAQFPDQIVLGSVYSQVQDLTYMDRPSEPPFIYKGFNDFKNNPYPESPSYPILNYLDGKTLGETGCIDYDVSRSDGPIPRYVPAYFDYEGPAHAKKILHGKLKSHAIEAGISANIIYNPEVDRFVLINNETGVLVGQIIEKDNDFIIVDANEKLLPITPNRMPKNVKKRFYHISIKLALAYLGLNENHVELSQDKSQLIIAEGNTIHATIPLLDQQIMEINWFSHWTSYPKNKAPEHLPPLIASEVNPRCSLRDILEYAIKLQGAEGILDGQSPDQVQNIINKLEEEIKSSQENIALIESKIEKNPKLKDIVKRPLFNARNKKENLEEQLTSFQRAQIDLKQSREFFDHFKDAVVLIGPVDPIFQDIAPTPFDPMSVPKVSVHGNMVKTILSNDHITTSEPWTEAFSIFLLSGIVAGLTIYQGKNNTYTRILAFVLQLGYIALTFLIFKHQELRIPLVAPIASSLTTNFVAICAIVIIQQKQKGRIKEMFGTYVSPELVNEMVDSESEPSLGGRNEEITAFFSDVQAFSSFSELLEPEQLVDLMNEYLTAMTDILHEEKGTLDKYIGDAIVALYGAPIRISNHAYQACISTLRIQKKQAELREKWKSEGDKWPPIVSQMQTRIGLNTGQAIVGNMGSHSRFNYTMMGDMVNLAARCESGAKTYGAYIMVTEETKISAENHAQDIAFRYLDKIVVKGRTKPVKIYEIVGLHDELSEETQKCLKLYAEGIEQYLKQNWERAIMTFERAKELEPFKMNEITPSSLLLDRCHTMKDQAHIENWDGVFVMTSK